MHYPASAIPDRRRTFTSFGISGSVHTAVLVWLVIGAAHLPRTAPRSLYDQEILPYETHLVWYNLHEKLPDIAPSADAEPSATPRAHRQFAQPLVAGPKDDADPSHLILNQAPPAQLPKPVPLPNVVAASSRPKPPRIFLPPPEAPPEPPPPPVLPDAPTVQTKPLSTASPLEAPTPRPKPRPFQPLPDKKPAPADPPPPELPEAPRVAVAKAPAPAAPLGIAVTRPQPLPFHPPPPVAPPRPVALALPDAPTVPAAPAPAADPALAAAPSRPRPKPFQAPAERTPTAPVAPSLPDAPVAAVTPPATAAPRLPRGFTAPPPKPVTQEPAPVLSASAPAVAAPNAPVAASLAIASLQPAKSTEIPPPPPSHAAAFSGAPEPRPEPTGTAANDKAAVAVPGLTAHAGVRDPLPTLAPSPEVSARARLLAELRTPISPGPDYRASPRNPSALRVSSAPDPRLNGRVVYAMAIQMPNVTSYSGSWMVWFAERVPVPGAAPAVVRPPEPRHKVDPAYIRAAADQGIQGVVRLAAVIGKEGRVDRIELLSGIDNRLDQSAAEALAKWSFDPATRDGAPIDVDAVFEVPFRLAPKPTR